MEVEKDAAAAPIMRDRLMSIDALRGFDMFWIIGGGEIVSGFFKGLMGKAPASVAYQLGHPAWQGFSAWDMIMPLFLFIVGASMPFSFSRRLKDASAAEKNKVYAHVLRRVVILFILGMIAQGNLLDFRLDKLHLYSNTLQSIACGYLVAAVLMLNVSIVVQAGSGVAMLAAYWLLMMFVPVGGQMGVLEPHSNVAMVVDQFILRGFRDGTTYTWLLSGLGFGATTLMGVMAGHILKSAKPQGAKVLWLVGAGVGCLAVGWVWSLHFPMIKHIWTSSMALWAGGWSFLLMAAFYYVIDVKKYRKWAFGFVIIGMNAIVVYMAVHVFDFRLMGDALVGGLAEHFKGWDAYMRETTSFIIVWLGLLFMYRQKVFVKI
ncbi:MAG: DUF5009 domain-containing protein [Candidatus Hydrogenedentes bacterium]|nr:DUF5009 domain-containing protein [Candidatus Hydrogenedentota bacterium]